MKMQCAECAETESEEWYADKFDNYFCSKECIANAVICYFGLKKIR